MKVDTVLQRWTMITITGALSAQVDDANDPTPNDGNGLATDGDLMGDPLIDGDGTLEVVPEPGSLLGFASGALLLAHLARRRRDANRGRP